MADEMDRTGAEMDAGATWWRVVGVTVDGQVVEVRVELLLSLPSSGDPAAIEAAASANGVTLERLDGVVTKRGRK